MTRALFVTTRTTDCANHVRAWDSFASAPAEHVTFDHRAIRNDWRLVEAAQRVRPDVIFYIGADAGAGNPRAPVFRSMREVAPTILLCSDAGDTPWHSVLNNYRARQCFDLMVSIDGARAAPVDMATLTPVDHRPFENDATRHIRCGFSGSIGRWNARSEIVRPLEWVAGLIIRDRPEGGSYDDHVQFLKRCKMLLNISHTGSGLSHHIKGRVVEAGFAGCALLELKASPIGDWFPDNCYISYSDARDASEILNSVSDTVIAAAARALRGYVSEHYTAAKIYGAMLARVGIGAPKSAARPAA